MDMEDVARESIVLDVELDALSQLSLENLSLTETLLHSDSSPPPSLAGTSFGRESCASYSSDGSSCSSTPIDFVFDPSKYLVLHKKAVGERLRRGTERSNKMKSLYRYWTKFLPDHYNEGMYKSFNHLAQEDAAAEPPHLLGISCLFSFFRAILSSPDTFDESLFLDFERIAHSTHDYVGLDLGVKCLVEYLLEHESLVAESGLVLSPITVSLLEAAKQQQKEEAEAEMDPRERLHQRLAEKKSMRSKRHERRDKDRQAINPALSPSLLVFNKLGGDEAAGGSPQTTSESGDGPQLDAPTLGPLEPSPAIVNIKPYTTSNKKSHRFTLFPRWKKRGQPQSPPTTTAQRIDVTTTASASQAPGSKDQARRALTLPDSDALGFGWS